MKKLLVFLVLTSVFFFAAATTPLMACTWVNSVTGVSYEGIDTALGCIPTETQGLAEWFLTLAIGIAGAFAILFIIIGGLKVMTSQGDFKAVQDGKETITAAIVGLLFVIFSGIILRIVGIKVLGF